MAELGLDLSKELPKRLTDDAVRAADVVITMGCELAAPGLPIVALSVGRELHDEDGSFARHYCLGDAGAALIRPDGYLAWRRSGPGSDARTALRSVAGCALGRMPGLPVRLRQAD
jgi:aromatic ring hydroxylase-like protein